MIEIRKQPFLENLCVLLICHDAQIDDFTEHLTSLYDPCVDTVYVCISIRLNFITRAKMLRQIRTVFDRVSDIRIKNVTDAQLKLIAFYIYFYANPGGKNENLSTRHRRTSPQRRDVPMSPARQRDPRSQRPSLRKHAQESN